MEGYKMESVIVAKVGEIPVGKMKHVEVFGKEIMVANVDGKYYAVSDRCGHMNVLLSMGTLVENTVTCPVHYARFDVTTGKVIAGPHLTSIDELKKFNLSAEMIKFVEHMNEFQSAVKTYDLPTFSVQVKDDNILIDV
jgi:nitrite reductase/ring-hydroxylating ferredoxin subunit